MNLTSFKLDIGGSTTFASMKTLWLSKKFSYIYEASPSSNLTFIMQSLYSHSMGYMVGTASFLHRLGGLYCLYCLYETQPFKPPFKVYQSLEASNDVDVQNIKHISENNELLGDAVEKIGDDWQAQRESFCKQTGLGNDDGYGQELEQLLLEHENNDEFQSGRQTSIKILISRAQRLFLVDAFSQSPILNRVYLG
ncbi:hypothetical protein K1719_037382 [Acacia pycnantha]|nr:hypothetical protein K1719_037382 [Acacia pycnantha]